MGGTTSHPFVICCLFLMSVLKGILLVLAEMPEDIADKT